MTSAPAFLEVLIVEVLGSAPTAVGDTMFLGPTGWAGSVGGGGLEWSLKACGEACLKQGIGARKEFVLNPKNDQCCGGRVVAILCPLPDGLIFNKNAPVVRLYGWETAGTPRCLGAWFSSVWHPAEGCDSEELGDLSWRAGLNVSGGRHYFLKRPASPMSLWLFGAGHVAAAIAPLAESLDYDVSVFDTRPEWNASSRFPPTTKRHLMAAPTWDLPDPAPVVLIMTHSHSLDFEIVERFLRAELPYLGVIGSQTKTTYFRHRLVSEGFDESSLRKLHMPMGLPGLGKKPHEIAVSVLADLLQQRHGKTLW